MRSYNRTELSLVGMTLAVVAFTACGGGGDRPATDLAVPGATSTQSSDAKSPADQAGSSDGGSSGQCVTIGDNLSYDELSASDSAPYVTDQELFRDLVDATPAGGHEKFLNDYCAVTVATYGADDPVSENVTELMASLEMTRLSALNGAYQSCLSIPANRSPSETFEPDPPRVAVLEIIRIANEDICPQIAFPQFPS